MKTLLITSFEPFGGENTNSGQEAVKLLPEVIGDWRIEKITLPVVFGKAAEIAIQAALDCNADAVLSIGQAAGRDAVTPETVGINLRYARIPDNEGNAPKDEPIIPVGDVAYFATLPARRMAEAISEAGIPARVSYSAGAYVCNDLLYSLLRRFHGTGVRVGFIHVPQTPGQGQPGMDSDTAARAIGTAVKAI